MSVLRVIWLVFLVVNLGTLAFDVVYSRRLGITSVSWKYPLHVFLALLGPAYLAFQYGAFCGGAQAGNMARDILKKTQHCPPCRACHSREHEHVKAAE